MKSAVGQKLRVPMTSSYKSQLQAQAEALDMTASELLRRSIEGLFLLDWIYQGATPDTILSPPSSAPDNPRLTHWTLYLDERTAYILITPIQGSYLPDLLQRALNAYAYLRDAIDKHSLHGHPFEPSQDTPNGPTDPADLQMDLQGSSSAAVAQE